MFCSLNKILNNISLTCEIINSISFLCSSVSVWNQSSETSAAWLSQSFLELSPWYVSAWHLQLHYPQSLFPLLCGWLVKGVQHKEPANKLNWTFTRQGLKTSSPWCTLVMWCLMSLLYNHTFILLIRQCLIICVETHKQHGCVLTKVWWNTFFYIGLRLAIHFATTGHHKNEYSLQSTTMC